MSFVCRGVGRIKGKIVGLIVGRHVVLTRVSKVDGQTVTGVLRLDGSAIGGCIGRCSRGHSRLLHARPSVSMSRVVRTFVRGPACSADGHIPSGIAPRLLSTVRGYLRLGHSGQLVKVRGRAVGGVSVRTCLRGRKFSIDCSAMGHTARCLRAERRRTFVHRRCVPNRLYRFS